MKNCLIILLVLVNVCYCVEAQEIHLRPRLGYGRHYNRIYDGEDLFRARSTWRPSASIWLDYRNRKNVGFMLGVGDGEAWSAIGPGLQTFYLSRWGWTGGGVTRYYAGVELPVGILIDRDRYLKSLSANRTNSQLFLGFGAAVNDNRVSGNITTIDRTSFPVGGNDFVEIRSRRTSSQPLVLGGWAHLRYQRYNKRGKETWSLLLFGHIAPNGWLYSERINYRTNTGESSFGNVNRGAQWQLQFSYPIRLWHKKPTLRKIP